MKIQLNIDHVIKPIYGLLKHFIHRICSIFKKASPSSDNPVETLEIYKYNEALRLERRIAFILSWQKFLIKVQSQLERDKHGIYYILALKKLLSSVKNKSFLTLYANVTESQLQMSLWNHLIFLFIKHIEHIEISSDKKNISIILKKNMDVSYLQIISKLREDYCKVRAEIYQLEQNFKKYSWLQALTVDVAQVAIGIKRAWTKSYYFKIANNYFLFFNWLADRQTSKDIPVLGDILTLKLPDGYVFAFSFLGSMLLMYLVEGVKGIMFPFIAPLSEALALNLEQEIVIGEKLNFSDTQIVKAYPYIKQAIGWGLILSGLTILSKVNPKLLITLTVVGHIASSSCRYLTGHGLDYLYHLYTRISSGSKTDSKRATVWNLYIKQPIQFLASWVAPKVTNKVLNFGFRFFQPARETSLMANRTLCLANSKRCQAEALAVYGLSASASPENIAFAHELLKDFPSLDPEATDIERMTIQMQRDQIHLATERLEDLELLRLGH